DEKKRQGRNMTTATLSPARGWFDEHRPLLDRALAAIRSREYYSAYPEVPSGKVYGENAQAEGKAAFDRRLGKRFELAQPGTGAWIGAERSPFGLPLHVSYPKPAIDQLLPAIDRSDRKSTRLNSSHANIS